MTVEQDDLDALRATVRGVIAPTWPDATAAERGDLGATWTAAAAQGWTDLASAELLPAVSAVVAELGAAGCPLPIADAHLAGLILPPDVAAAVGDGTVRPVVAAARLGGDEVVARHVEAVPWATHLLAVDPHGPSFALHALSGAGIEDLPGIAVPAWSQVRVGGPAECSGPIEEHGLLVLELLLAARALGAAGRSHELAVEHAGTRRQFGRPVGHFQAVSHRLVNAQIELTAARHLLDHAVALHVDGDPAWPVAARVYVDHAAAVGAVLQFAAQHTLAAVGYFTEHEAPWLLRRVHADLARARTFTAGPSLGECLLDRGAGLPAFDLGESAEQLRTEVLKAFAPWTEGTPSRLGGWDDNARAVLRDRGWVGVGWPAAEGGGGRPITEVLAFSEALAYAAPPLGNILMGINSVAPVLIAVGTPEQKARFLPEIRTAQTTIALGYSEPESGSDLASLRTRATPCDGGWVVSGQKMWGTCMPDSQYILLAARTGTDPDAKPQAGISLFLVDADAPGITRSDHVSLAGEVSSTTFWDEVFVPAERLVGDVNGGWRALTSALAGERVLIGATVAKVHRDLDLLVELLRGRPELVAEAQRPLVRAQVARLAVRVQAARALVIAGVGATVVGRGATLEAPMAKIVATELREDFHATAAALLGPDALLAPGASGGIGGGHFELGLRASVMGVVAGGTNDIQRNLVARGMGLPR